MKTVPGEDGSGEKQLSVRVDHEKKHIGTHRWKGLRFERSKVEGSTGRKVEGREVEGSKVQGSKG